MQLTKVLSRSLLLLIPGLMLACSSAATQAPDSGTTVDSGTTDAGSTQNGMPDAGDGGSTLDAGSPDAGMQPPPYVAGNPADWNFAESTCLYFEDGAGGTYTVGVKYDTGLHNLVPSREPYALQHTLNGAQIRTDEFSVATTGLYLMARQEYTFTSTGPSSPSYGWISGAGFLFLPTELSVGMSSTVNRTSDPRTDPQTPTSTSQAISYSESAEAEEDVMALGATQHATRYKITWQSADGKDNGTDLYWVTPKVGIVRLQLAGQASPVTLSKVEPNSQNQQCFYPLPDESGQ